jgi:uncharacterized protein YbjT (DUF2867 family)
VDKRSHQADRIRKLESTKIEMIHLESKSYSNGSRARILLTGATGYVGGKLLASLSRASIPVRCLTRDEGRFRKTLDSLSGTIDRSKIEVAEGDVTDRQALLAAFEGLDTAYYFVHSMGYAEDFERRDREAAECFALAAREVGIKRVIYLGGLGDDSDPNLSPHLRSRHEVGKILRELGPETIEFRASAVLGPGSLSFEMIRSLTERLPVMICPRWLKTPTQPISISDLLRYLICALDLPEGESRIFEIGGNEVVTYGQLIQEYARQRGLRRWLISVPILTPYLSGLWLGLVTPATAEVGRHLIEGLRNPTVVRDKSALDVFPWEPMTVSDAMREAVDEGA